MDIIERESAATKAVTLQLNKLMFAWRTMEGVSNWKGNKISQAEKENAKKAIPEITDLLSKAVKTLFDVTLEKQAIRRQMDGLQADNQTLIACEKVLKGELRDSLVFSSNFESLRSHFKTDVNFKWLWE